MARRVSLSVLLIVLVSALSACQVRPLYAPGPIEHDASAELANIEVAPVEGRAGQLVRNELQTLLQAGGAGNAAYRLSLSVRQAERDSIVRRVDGEATNRVLTMQVTYTLTRLSDGQRMLIGRVSRAATFEVSRQRFANERAALDATERTAREAAEEIRLRLATFFASGGVAQAHMSPELGPDEETRMEDTLLGDTFFDEEADF